MSNCTCGCHPHTKWGTDGTDGQRDNHPICDCTCCKNGATPDPTPEPLLPELALREGEVATTMIVDLIERMEKAGKTLIEMAGQETSVEECERITAKANGVSLCVSYAREALGMKP